jgi:type II secretory pathway pseudopilin PulG
MIRTQRRLHAEDGYAVVIAIAVLAIMLVIGLAVLATVDTGSELTREQRVEESALSLTEGALYSQGAVLARNWPSAADRSYLNSCTPATSADTRCPNKDTLDASNSTQPSVAAFQATDYVQDGNWQTWVRDNYGDMASAYDPAIANASLTGAKGTCPGPCAWDFNGDHAMWVQSRAKVRDRYRNVVALLKLEELAESVAQRAFVSGAVSITNNGNHGGTYMLDGSGSTVTVRCPPDNPGAGNATCTEYEAGQITPAPVQDDPPDWLTTEQIDRFRERAVIDGTYYADCPPDDLTGQVVFVEKCLNPGIYNGGGRVACTPPAGLKPSCVNTIDKPGLLIVHCGALQTAGNWTYVGIMYFANKSLADGSCSQRGDYTCTGQQFNGNDVLQTNGGFGVWGALVADGPACIKLGSNNLQVKSDRNAFLAAKTYGTVGLVQNTWRELPPN